MFFLFILSALYSSVALAAGPGIEFINYYDLILQNFNLDAHARHEWVAVVGALLTFTVLLVVGIVYKTKVGKVTNDFSPSNKFNLVVLVESVLDFVLDLANDILGKEKGAGFAVLLCSLFLFILTSNLSGLIPGLPPATESINTNLAMGLIVFLVYNVAGVKEHGFAYIKQFLGPVWWLAPLLLCIETVSHLARPLSLSLRLYGNIFGDHLVLSVFTGLSYLILPAFLLFFGLLVAMLQSFVFTLLTSIYISMAVSHDH